MEPLHVRWQREFECKLQMEEKQARLEYEQKIAAKKRITTSAFIRGEVMTLLYLKLSFNVTCR
jgi:hypothetical protein